VRARPAGESKFQWLARLGFLVRGLLCVVIALLVLAAGRTEDLTGAIGYHSIIEARYRSIHKPPTDHVKRKIEQQIAA